MDTLSMNDVAFSVCVYCGSRPGADPAFATAAAEVGKWIATHNGGLIYGGGKGGLMGIVAQAALQAGGRVVGIIPRSMVEKEWANQDCTELHIVDNMHQRKQMMAEHADAFLALPGGMGTLEELFEVWTWRQLDFHGKPIGLLNTSGYYQTLLDFLSNSVRQQFVSDWQFQLIKTSSNPAALLQELVQAAGFAPAARTDEM
jgi:uncharacterized protein (TIGR00730 family)